MTMHDGSMYITQLYVSQMFRERESRSTNFPAMPVYLRQCINNMSTLQGTIKVFLLVHALKFVACTILYIFQPVIFIYKIIMLLI